MENERVRVSLTVREELLQKMIHKDLVDTDDDQNAQMGTDGTQEVITKSKKKKNKKKKNKAAKKEGEGLENPEAASTDKTVEHCKENENIQPKVGKKKDYLSKIFCIIQVNLKEGLLKQNTGNVKLDNEVEEFERRLDLETDESNGVQEKIKPNINDEWIQSLRQRLNKINKVF